MSNLNAIQLQGNLVEDPKLFPTKNSDGFVARFTIAVNNGYGEKRSTTFIDCVAFGKQAEVIEKHLAKGRQVIVNGELHQDNWEKDGQKRSKHVVYLNSFNGFFFVGNKPEGEAVAEEVATATTQSDKLF